MNEYVASVLFEDFILISNEFHFFFSIFGADSFVLFEFNIFNNELNQCGLLRKIIQLVSKTHQIFVCLKKEMISFLVFWLFLKILEISKILKFYLIGS